MKSRFSKIFPAILLMGLLVSCAPPYHQKDERYIFVAFNTNLPYWQEAAAGLEGSARSEEHTSELQSQSNLVCRLLLEKKKNQVLTNMRYEPTQRRVNRSIYIQHIYAGNSFTVERVPVPVRQYMLASQILDGQDAHLVV